jgi:ABC-type uncharacterized transport system substrate-binding protein
LQEIVPDLRRLAIMGNVGNPSMVLEMHAVQAAASTLGIDQVTTVEIRRTEDITSRMEA